MLTMIAGLFLFLGTHSIRIFADDWRSRQINQRGETLWKGVYSLVAITGFVLIVTGYAETRLDPHVIWLPPQWLKQTVAILLLPTFVLLIAAYLPGTKIKSASGHPMVASVKLWAFAHLLANGNLADIILFGSFTVWAIFDYRASRRRDKKSGVGYPSTGISRDMIAISAGIVIWIAFAVFLHEWLIGVKPFA
jgi:uncharacterized membrane protein